jgi:hypothetical protein
VRHVFVAGQQVLAGGRPMLLDVGGISGLFAESQARMRRDAGRDDDRGVAAATRSRRLSLPLA